MLSRLVGLVQLELCSRSYSIDMRDRSCLLDRQWPYRCTWYFFPVCPSSINLVGAPSLKRRRRSRRSKKKTVNSFSNGKGTQLDTSSPSFFPTRSFLSRWRQSNHQNTIYRDVHIARLCYYANIYVAMGIANAYKDFKIGSARCLETIKLKLQFFCRLLLEVNPTCRFPLIRVITRTEYIYELLIHFEP